ncbi:MAG TPA: ABC transporter permease [Sporichthya sp.]|nr:ABC transporter permease [Sporichthya sp.]
MQAVKSAWPATEYWILRNRRYWRTQLSAALLTPLLYLAGIGLGVGSLVDDNAGGVHGVDYLGFLAPGLLALAALQQAFEESAWPVIGALRWWRSYPSQQVTTLSTVDVLTGHLIFVALKVTGTVVVCAAVAALFGAFDSAWALAAVPAAVLCGIAHAPVVAGISISLRSEIQLAAFYRFVFMPISLFSGVFFPVAQLPVGIEQVAYATPLWHGVDLCRDLALGEAAFAPSAGHVAYLALWAVAGYALARRMYVRRLEP